MSLSILLTFLTVMNTKADSKSMDTRLLLLMAAWVLIVVRIVSKVFRDSEHVLAATVDTPAL